MSRNILFNLTGHGFLDLGAYDAYLSGKLEDYDHPEEAIAASIARLPEVDPRSAERAVVGNLTGRGPRRGVAEARAEHQALVVVDDDPFASQSTTFSPA